MKSVTVQKLAEMCDGMADLDTLKAWAQAQVNEENAKAKLAGDLVPVQVECRRRNDKGEIEAYKQEILSKPVGAFFALHVYGPVDYGTKGKHVLTHKASGLSVVSNFQKPAAAVVALVETLESLAIDWEKESPLTGLPTEVSRACQDAVKAFNS